MGMLGSDIIYGCEVVRTNMAHPECYNVFCGNAIIGCLRLNGQEWTVSYLLDAPDGHDSLGIDEVIYQDCIASLDGEFHSSNRYGYLTDAVDRLLERYLRGAILIEREWDV